MKRRQSIHLAVLVFICLCAYSAIQISTEYIQVTNQEKSNAPAQRPPPTTSDELPAADGNRKPQDVPGPGSHPIQYLTSDAQKEFEKLKGRQSKSLEDAVKEYRRRYGMPPPPHFDKWFEFAKSNGVQLVDEFDTIYDLMTPFWGLKPKTIRARVKEALGFDNALIGASIRHHKVSNIEGGKQWQRNATQGMMSKFLQYLPDMDLAFNSFDEPRVMIPHEDLARLVRTAKSKNMPASNAVRSPANDFSATAAELGEGKRFEETKLTRFNTIPQEATWTHSRMSCSPDSPARVLEEDEQIDDLSKYGISELGFIFNTTAMSDVCLTPSLSSTYGFFDRPNTYSVVHDLFPIFSQSKISSYGDIIYPSPWYWSEQVTYEEEKDKAWAEKENKLFWRGSTTGGYSRHGGWRRQHRQQLVQKINAADQIKVMTNQGGSGAPKWEVQEVPRGDHRNLIDVHFSHIGQCDVGDCEAQAQFFNLKEPVDQQDAWAYRHLLDMDGNAFSGRFYAFLRSRSLTYKFALFREWHAEWIKPWVHYVPLSLQGNDWLEAVRYFSGDERGSREAEGIAAASREWADKVVRKEDMEVWFFRLLLEYARVIDDNRETIGFDPASANKKLKQPAH